MLEASYRSGAKEEEERFGESSKPVPFLRKGYVLNTCHYMMREMQRVKP